MARITHRCTKKLTDRHRETYQEALGQRCRRTSLRPMKIKEESMDRWWKRCMDRQLVGAREETSDEFMDQRRDGQTQDLMG